MDTQTHAYWTDCSIWTTTVVGNDSRFQRRRKTCLLFIHSTVFTFLTFFYFYNVFKQFEKRHTHIIKQHIKMTFLLCSKVDKWFRPINIHRVSEKTVQISFCQNFVKFPPILVIFDRKMANRLKLCKVHSFSTSSNSRHHTTVLNADVINCYTTLKVVIFKKLVIDLISAQ